jgi:hypothetical protein
MRLLIVGSGRCVWKDLEKLGFPDSPLEADVMAVNDMIMHYPYHLTHAYSLNKKMLDKWVEARRPAYSHLRKHCPKRSSSAERHNREIPAKSSGVNAVYCGLDLGYSEIVVCGVPLDNTGHYFDPPWIKTAFDRSAGHLLYCDFGENVFFMSGRASGERPDWLL